MMFPYLLGKLPQSLTASAEVFTNYAENSQIHQIITENMKQSPISPHHIVDLKPIYNPVLWLGIDRIFPTTGTGPIIRNRLLKIGFLIFR